MAFSHLLGRPPPEIEEEADHERRLERQWMRAQGVMDNRADPLATDLAFSMSALNHARCDYERALSGVAAALRAVQARAAELDPRAAAPAAARAGGEPRIQMVRPPAAAPEATLIEAPRAPSSKRRRSSAQSAGASSDGGSAVRGGGEAPSAVEPEELGDLALGADHLPRFVLASLACVDELHSRARSSKIEALHSSLQLAAWATQASVAQVQREHDESSGMIGGAWITRLPIEVGMHILRLLPIHTQSSVARTCHTLAKWSSHLMASRVRLTASDIRVCAARRASSAHAAGVAQQLADVEPADMAGDVRAVHDLNYVMAWLCARCPSLQVVHLPGTRELRDSALIALSTSARDVRDLDVSGCLGVTDEGIAAVAGRCHSLRRLSVAGCARVTDVSLTAVASQCGLLVHLDVSGTSVGDKSLFTVARHCPLLKSLAVACCAAPTERGVHMVARSLANLEQLDASHCPAIGELFLALNGARAARGEGGEGAPRAGAAPLTVPRRAARRLATPRAGLVCTYLTDLRLRGCPGLTDSVRPAPRAPRARPCAGPSPWRAR